MSKKYRISRLYNMPNRFVNRNVSKIGIITLLSSFLSCQNYSGGDQREMKDGIDTEYYRKFNNGSVIKSIKSITEVHDYFANGFYVGYFPSGKLKEKGQYKDGSKTGDWTIFDTLNSTCVQNWDNYHLLSVTTQDSTFVLDVKHNRLSKKNSDLLILITDSLLSNSREDITNGITIHTHDTLLIINAGVTGLIANKKLNYVYDFSEKLKTSKVNLSNWNFTIVDDQFTAFNQEGHSLNFKIK